MNCRTRTESLRSLENGVLIRKIRLFHFFFGEKWVVAQFALSPIFVGGEYRACYVSSLPQSPTDEIEHSQQQHGEKNRGVYERGS